MKRQGMRILHISKSSQYFYASSQAAYVVVNPLGNPVSRLGSGVTSPVKSANHSGSDVSPLASPVSRLGSGVNLPGNKKARRVGRAWG